MEDIFSRKDVTVYIVVSLSTQARRPVVPWHPVHRPPGPHSPHLAEHTCGAYLYTPDHVPPSPAPTKAPPLKSQSPSYCPPPHTSHAQKSQKHSSNPLQTSHGECGVNRLVNMGLSYLSVVAWGSVVSVLTSYVDASLSRC